MKKTVSIILTCVLILALAASVTASNGTISKEITYRDVKITLNGNSLTPKDANGNPTEPFIMDGSTYLPVRAVADSLGLTVEWDAATSTVKLSDGNATQSTQPTQPSSKDPYQITDTIFTYGKNSIGKTEYTAIVEITNTGSNDLYLKDCTFDFEDNSGHLLQTENWVSHCPDVIAPGEKGYFYNSIGSSYLDDDISLTNGINFVPQVSIITSNTAPIEYEVFDTSLRNGSFGPEVTGRVKNTSDQDESLFYINVVYFGKDGKPLAITGTNISDFTSGKTASFDISGVALRDDVTLDTIGDYKIIARASHYQYR